MNRNDYVRKVAGDVGDLLDHIDRSDNYSAKIYGEACFLAGLDQLRRAMGEAEVVEILRLYADHGESALLHARRMTGKLFGRVS